VAGARIDAAVEQRFLATMGPSELALAVAVDHEAAGHAQELAQQWRARREQAAYEARRAEKRYKAVDPDHRVVARTLEREWESKLREREEVERQYTEARRTKRVELSPDDRARVRELARDLPAVWRSPVTPPADRKAMMRLVIEAISLSPIEVPRRATRVKVAWQSGTVTEIEVPRPHRRDLFRTPPPAVERMRALAAAGRHDEEIAEVLNTEGMRTGRGLAWNTWAVRWTRKRADLPGRARPAAARAPSRPVSRRALLRGRSGQALRRDTGRDPCLGEARTGARRVQRFPGTPSGVVAENRRGHRREARAPGGSVATALNRTKQPIQALFVQEVAV